MERFFEAGTLSDEELVAGLKSATASAKLFPLVCTSGLVNIGVPQLLETIVAIVPAPVANAADENPRRSAAEILLEALSYPRARRA